MSGSNMRYYDVLAGLSALEKSSQVVFSATELQQLTQQSHATDKGIEGSENSKAKVSKPKRVAVHGYLGGKVSLADAAQVEYEVGHSLLGSYVPRQQLEALSSVDFSHHFHRTLECKAALETHDVFLAGAGQLSLPFQSHIESPRNSEAKRKRKVIICKRCQSRFIGPHRRSQLREHACVD
ncbi:BAH_G0001910.mRNA.1.CDS.1 [Saccharomyces cerevisiae]|nr:Ldb7p [Saccharomyces cerevisiae YJM1418]CAD6598311.1 HLJ1_G0014130.mRNA.1.CDS.1 [Saccharomyces cerevisiae]CAI4252906.1 BAH_G0001910.mRNA.1.CDS.1 [Saccharomyces cerevisiae]CAI4257026.1 CCN_G0001970.mRNA.1.CDS.1 [Saccharomyces cerevisiae]CAI7040246.1 BAH_G0001910.mRNA.1.CDS.1 [Saccharomyces cerevisiae]